MKWIYRHPRRYEFVDNLCSLSLSNRVRRKALSGLSGESLLEIGIGPGKCFDIASSPVKIGVDSSPQMLETARSRFPESLLVLGTAYGLPLKDKSVEVSILSYAIKVFSRPVDALKEALRVSSRVVVIEYYKPRFIPGFLWKNVFERFGRAVYGSRRFDLDSIASLARKTTARDLYAGTYRVIVFDGS